MTTALNSDFRDAPTASASSLAKSAIPALAGRILIAPIFLLSGVSKVAAPAMMIGYIQSVGLPVPVLALGIAIAVELLGGVALLMGYLERAWARHATIDWIFLDMLLTREACLFGEEVKMRMLPGPKTVLGFHPFYFKYSGNLQKMQSDWTGYAERLLQKASWIIGVPIGAIYAAFHFDYVATGIMLTTIYGGIVAFWFARKVFMWALRIVRRVLGRKDRPTSRLNSLHS
jgi:hypothetical protein